MCVVSGGELGIRTPDTLLAYTRLAGEHLRPLGQLSERRRHGYRGVYCRGTICDVICNDTLTTFNLQGE